MESISEIRSLKRIFIFLIVSLTISVVAAFLYIYNDTQRDRINDLTYTSKVIKSYYELSFHQWELSLLSLGNRLVEIEDPQERLDYANTALKVYEKELLAFGLASPDGQVMTFTGLTAEDSLPNLVSSERTRRSFQLAMKGESLTLGEIYFFENVSDWILPIRVPIFNTEGEIIAVNTSAINYSTMVEELDEFGFDANYQIHLINNEFGTTQLIYPLDPTKYDSLLGSVSLTYEKSDTLEVLKGGYLISREDPVSKAKILCATSSIDIIDHNLVVSVGENFLMLEFLDRFKLVFIVYIVLAFASFLLYNYMKKNLQKSIQNLRTERANLISIFESTNDIIGLFDEEKRLVAFNTSFEVTARATDNLELKKGLDVFSAMKDQEYAKQFSSNFDKALKGEKFRKVVNYPGPNGDIIFRFTYNPIYQEDKIKGVSMFAEDITEIRKYQNQLEEYNKNLEATVLERTKELEDKNLELVNGYEKLKSTQQQLIRAEKMASLGILSAGIGHEINNPLNFIKHGAISLKEQLEKDHQKNNYDDYFYAIEEGVQRASTIVSGLSHFSRAGDSMDEASDIHEVINNSLTLLSNRIKSKDIVINKAFDAQNFTVVGNEGKLHQVFTNLINNAEQAIKNKGEILIRTKNKNGHIIVEIEDSGMGMSKEVMEKILDPFFTTKEPGEGTGLGMFICQMIIEEHNAVMDVSSEEGKGTIFSLTFKIA